MIEKDREKVLREGIEEGFYPRYLYKFWSYKSAIRYLESGCFRYSSYQDFNDPFEGAYSLIGDASKEELISFLMRLHLIGAENVELLARSITTNDIKHMMNPYIKETLSEIGIFCMTTENQNLLMWAHYADQHEGVCLKFDLLNDISAFSSLHKVAYTTEFLNFNCITSPDRINDCLVHKSVDWIYEHEYRVLKYKCAGQILPVNPKSLIEVTFGCRMIKENRQHIKDVISSKPEYTVEYKQAGIHTQDFKILICNEDDSRISYG